MLCGCRNCGSHCIDWLHQRKTTVLKSSGWSVVIDGHLLRNKRPMAAPIRAGFPTRAVADKGKALTTDPQHPTERGLPLVQLSVKIRRSKKELSYVAGSSFVWIGRVDPQDHMNGTMIGIFKAERTYTWFLGRYRIDSLHEVDGLFF